MIGKSLYGSDVALLSFGEIAVGFVEERQLVEPFASPCLIKGTTPQEQKSTERDFITPQRLQIIKLLLEDLQKGSELRPTMFVGDNNQVLLL